MNEKERKERQKKTLLMIPRIVILMLFTAYLSGFVKTAYDYAFVAVAIILLGVFLFFIDIKRYLQHI